MYRYKALRKLKLKKVTGFDKIPNEVLKNPGVREGLFKLFSYCFESGLVPSNWFAGHCNPNSKRVGKGSQGSS